MKEPSRVLKDTENFESAPGSSCVENVNTHANRALSLCTTHEDASIIEAQGNNEGNPTCLEEFSTNSATMGVRQGEQCGATSVKQDDSGGALTGTGVSLASSHTDDVVGRVVHESKEMVTLSAQAPAATEIIEKSCIPKCPISESLDDTSECSKSKSSDFHVNCTENVREASSMIAGTPERGINIVKSSDVLVSTHNVCHSSEVSNSYTNRGHSSKSDDDSAVRTCNADAAPMVNTNNVHHSSAVITEDANSFTGRGHSDAPTLTGIDGAAPPVSTNNLCNSSVATKQVLNSCTDIGHSDVSPLPGFMSKQEDDPNVKICDADAACLVGTNNVGTSVTTVVADSCIEKGNSSADAASQAKQNDDSIDANEKITGKSPHEEVRIDEPCNSAPLAAEKTPVEADKIEDCVPCSSGEVNDAKSLDKAHTKDSEPDA